MSNFLENIVRKGAGLPLETPPLSLNAGTALQHGDALALEGEVLAEGQTPEAPAGEFTEPRTTAESYAGQMSYPQSRAPEAAPTPTPVESTWPSSEPAATPDERQRPDTVNDDGPDFRPRFERRDPAGGEEDGTLRATADRAESLSSPNVSAAPSFQALLPQLPHEPRPAAHERLGLTRQGAVQESASAEHAPVVPSAEHAPVAPSSAPDREETVEGFSRPARDEGEASPPTDEARGREDDRVVVLQPQAPNESDSRLPAAPESRSANDAESRPPLVHVRIGSVDVRQNAPPAPRPPERARGFGNYSPARRYLDRRWY